MPSVSFDSRSLLLGSARGRDQRLAIVAASFDPALVGPDSWLGRLAEARRAGFNAVSMRVPWNLHEPMPGLLRFDGHLDVRAAIEAAATAGLKVLLRIGPCVGGPFALDGMPEWIAGLAGDRIREANPAFLDRVARYWRRLAEEFVDLQAARDGRGGEHAARPVVAVGIEDGWHCLDEDVGAAYFSALVRFVREAGVEVPLFTANSCWYVHEGLIDAWRMGSDGRARPTAAELRQVQPESPPLLLDVRPSADEIGGAIAARADFVMAGRGTGEGHSDRRPFGSLRRPLVFASTFGTMLAGFQPDDSLDEPNPSPHAGALRGSGSERLTVVMGVKGGPEARSAPSIRVAADGSSMPAPVGSPSGIDFYASDLEIAGARLERCSGSLVALLGDLLVVAGKARSRLRVCVDGSEVALAVPADGSLPKVTRVRGLRIAVVPYGLADGIGIAPDGFDFVDAGGSTVATLATDGSVARPKQRASRPTGEVASPPLELRPFEALAEAALLDGTHARYASVASPGPLGAYGVEPSHAYYRARLRKPASGSGRILALPFARVGSGRVALDGVARGCGTSPFLELPASKGVRTIVVEVRSAGFASDAAPVGGGGEIRTGVFGPLVELTALKGVKCEIVPSPAFDGTRLRRFVLGYDSRDPARAVERTLRWNFPARSTPVVMRFPTWWVESSCRSRSDRRPWNDALRLNGELAVAGRSAFSGELVWLDGSRLSPMRPKALAKGEKPPKAKAAQLVAGRNEVLLDLDGGAFATREMEEPLDLERLRREVEFHEVRREVDADWAFARIEPPASWIGARKAVRKATGVPTWFRSAFRAEPPVPVRLVLSHPAGAAVGVFLNGAAMDGAAGGGEAVPVGKGRARRIERVLEIPASCVRRGENEIAIFSPVGTLPEVRFDA